jgi:hypothetical protein
MLVLECLIEISGKGNKKIQFTYANSIEVNTSIHNLTDTATIVLPRKMNMKGAKLGDYIECGNSITIKTWYTDYGKHEMIFKGYITGVSSETPITIEAENEMWSLKRTKVKPERFENFELKKFFSEYCSSIKLDMPEDIKLGEVIIPEETTVAQVLDYLKQNYPLDTFFNNGKMVAVLQTSKLDQGDKITFKKGGNTISDTLKYILADNVNIQVIAKSILPDNKKLEAKAPADGKGCEVRIFDVPGCKTETELKNYAENKLKTFKANKMSGSFTAFGIPLVKKGDKVFFQDEENSERNNKTFIVDAVQYSFGLGGYRQTVTLGVEI